jgi:hypothetical protein
MPYDILNNTWKLLEPMEKLVAEKKAGFELQKRKHDDWNENYELYRNKVKINRLTQRQAVNIPLMKETIKTLLSKIDDAPNVDWKELNGDDFKELIYQEIWNQQMKDNNIELLDILDKKNVLLYGLSAKKLNITKDGVSIEVLDPYDVIFDPLMNAWDLDSSRFIIQQNIFRSVRDIIADERYTSEGKEELKIWIDSPAGITQGEKAREEWEKKMERLKAMGIESQDFPFFAAGDRIINLTEHHSKIWDTKKKEFIRRVIVYADDTIELLNEPLKDLIGIDFWPFIVWSEDPDISDVYPDAVADLVRTPNKVLNVWFSQLIENRTLKNFQMHWFLPVNGYTPQTYTPGPGMMLPAPPGEDINKVIQPVQISGLDDTLTAIQVLTNIVERGSGATAIQKGATEPGQQTLGEIEILVGKAQERTTAMAKFYRLAWYRLAKKWDSLMQANAPKFLMLSKLGREGKIVKKRIFSNDWISEYEPIVSSSSEQEMNTTKSIQKFMFVVSQFPNNMALRKIAQKRELEMLDLTPEELKAVEKDEEQPQLAIEEPGEAVNLQNEIDKKLQMLNE